VTVLLIGVDSAPGRTQALTDTILVASYDPLGNTVSVLSVPRDLVDVPLPNGRVYRPKINSLASFVERNAGDFAWAGGSGPRVLAAALGEMLGTPIHYWAEVDMGGFVNLVDALGGIDVHATTALDAPGYRAYGVDGFAITPGVHHLDGGHSLAYARIRKAAGESDFTRAARQQEILVAVRDRIASGGFLADLPGFLDAVGQTVRTDMPADRLPLLASRIGDVGRRDVYRAVITPPLVRFGSDERGSILIPDQEAIRNLADQLFTPPGGTPSAGAAGDG
jgi:LCP family protein required for cell wall assembly